MKKNISQLIFILLLFFLTPELFSQQFARAEPEKTGLSSSHLRALADTVENWTETGEITGAVVLIIKDGYIVLNEAMGYADTKRGIKMETDHIFRLRSMTKPFVGTAILMLAEEGKLCTEDKVSMYIPSFNKEDKKDITIYQLLTHTSGIRGSIFSSTGSPFETLWEAVENIGNEGTLAFSPGTSYSYSDPGSSTLGAIIESVTGKPAEYFIYERIIGPAGLNDTFCTLVDEDDTRRPRISATYRGEKGNWEQYWDNSLPIPIPFFRASGGMFSTVHDYAKFMNIFLNHGKHEDFQLLSPLTTRLAISPLTLSVYSPVEWKEQSRFYGLHWTQYTERWASGAPVSPGTFGHGGSDGTLAFADPQNNLIALYFTQSRGNNTRSRFMQMVFELVAESGK